MTHYHGEAALVRHLARTKRSLCWFYADSLRSFRDLDTGDMHRLSYDSHDRMREVSDWCRKAKLAGDPSSYGWIWRRLAPDVVPGELSRKDCGAMLPSAWVESYPAHDWTLTGEALTFHDCREYDMRSAYGWALGTAPIPLPASGSVSKRYKRGATMAVIDGDGVRLSPPCFRVMHGYRFATVDDVDRYSLDTKSALAWVTYKHMLDLSHVVERLFTQFPEWIAKSVMRSAWGTYLASAELRQESRVGSKVVKSHTVSRLNATEIPTAVVSRVNARLYEIVASRPDSAVRIATDSITLAGGKPLKTGTMIGDWVLKREYDKLTIGQNPGWVMADGFMVKHAGIPKNQLRTLFKNGALFAPDRMRK